MGYLVFKSHRFDEILFLEVTMVEKELIQKLDMYDFSKELFVSNYKTIKKEKRKCMKLLNKIGSKSYGELNDFELMNYKCLKRVLSILNVSLNIGKRILNNGVTSVEELKQFYRTIVHLYVNEGNE